MVKKIRTYFRKLKGDCMITLVYYFTNENTGEKMMDIFENYDDVNEFIKIQGPKIEVVEISDR